MNSHITLNCASSYGPRTEFFMSHYNIFSISLIFVDLDKGFFHIIQKILNQLQTISVIVTMNCSLCGFIVFHSIDADRYKL